MKVTKTLFISIILIVTIIGASFLLYKDKITTSNAIYIIKSEKSISETGTALVTALKKRGFGVLIVHNFKETFSEKGISFDKECLVYEVCNPVQAKKILESDIRMSTSLPCRISIFSEGNTIKLATIRPSAIVTMFNNTGLSDSAQEVENIMIESMNEAVSN
ncbi:DUF302 domain-containing protein [Thermoproteota archaeon]